MIFDNVIRYKVYFSGITKSNESTVEKFFFVSKKVGNEKKQKKTKNYKWKKKGIKEVFI